MTSRGRNPSLSPRTSHTGLSRVASPGRAISRERSQSNTRASSLSDNRATNDAELENFRWSILTHDPYERFEPMSTKPAGTPDPDDDISDEEQIMEDRAFECTFDICDLKLPNYRMSINDYYKKRSGGVAKQMAGLDITDPKANLKRKASDIQSVSEVLALSKGLQDAKDLDSTVPSNMAHEIQERLKELGVKDPTGMKIDDLVSIDNAKEKVICDYKKLLFNDKSQDDNLPHITREKKITISPIDVNEKACRASTAVTLGDFFHGSLDPRRGKVYLVYVDQSLDSQMALQYTIGALAKSGDVIYLVSTSDTDQSTESHKTKVDRITENITSFLKPLYDPDFKLHFVIESTYRKYTKHFLSQLVKFLKPTLFVVCYQTLVSSDKLKSYITPCPFMILKRKPRRS